MPILPVLRNRRSGSRRWGGTDPVERPTAAMGPAVGLCAVATVLAGVVAYGTHPLWAQYHHGLDFILLSRQLQWPFIVLSLIATLALVGTIIAGRRRAGWLIGLAPVLALFGHRFATDPISGMAAIESPVFVAPDAAAGFIDNDDYIVGLTFEGKNYAYPFAALYSTPAVIHAEHDKRLLVMWSAPANRVLAFTITRDVKARDLDIVSTPANALLMYDTSRGVFINGLTGRTVDGKKPDGFLNSVHTVKMPWWKWRVAFPDTQVMVPAGKLAAKAPKQPMSPTCPMPPIDTKHAADLKVVLIGTQSPAAVQSASLGLAPVNLSADGVPVMAFRDPATSAARGFRRKIDDLSPRFKANRDPKRAGVLFIDTDTNSGWNAAGVAIEAKKDFRGKRLPAVPVDDELSWGVVKFWYPQLQLNNADGGPQTVIEMTAGGSATGSGAGKALDPAQAQSPTTPRGGTTSTVTLKPSHPAKPVKKKLPEPTPSSR
jgi:hypothetical protein